MNTRNNLPLYFSIAIVIGIYIGSVFNFSEGSSFFEERTSQGNKLKKLLQFIENDYVDRIDSEQIIDEVIYELIGKLDPHSAYIPKEQFLGTSENLRGDFEGIGVQFKMHKDSLVVTHVIKEGPSEKAGLLAGDRILMAGKDTLYNRSLGSSDIVKILKGPKESEVLLDVYRRDSTDILTFSIKRNKVKIQSAEVAYMLTDSLGYLKLDRFALTSASDFEGQLLVLKEQGAKNLVVDLRQNGGGYIHIANQIIDQFLTEGKLIVFTESKNGKKEEFFATASGNFEEGTVYILIDEGSASASEIFAGALQDNDKGVIVGRRSFGKGLVQQERQLGDGSAVRLTIARYFTPTGRSIQKPYEMDGSEAYAANFENRFINGELLSKDSIKVSDSLKYTTPGGKHVYGGGGIIPDVFVPIDTTKYLENKYVYNVSSFSFDYADRHRTRILKEGVEAFVQEMDTNSEILDAYIAAHGKVSWNLTSNRRAILKHYLKVLIIRHVFDEVDFHRENNKKDNMIQMVLQLENQVNN
ncbi:MAG: S41 family peptidase [Flavicella sp.]